MKMATDCEAKHEEMLQHFSQLEKLYFRFSVEQGVQATNIHRVKHTADVETHTEAYLATQETRQRLADAASEIVGRLGKLAVQYLGV